MTMIKFNISEKAGSCLFTLFMIILFGSFGFPGTSHAQYQYDYEWMLGYDNHAGGEPSTGRFAVNLISFHSEPPDTFRTGINGTSGGSNTLSMANSIGELIYFSNGCRLFDKQGNFISGEEVLQHGKWFNDKCLSDNPARNLYPTITQSMVSMPMDKNDSLFFVVYQRCEFTHDTNLENPFVVVCFELYLKKIILLPDGTYQALEKELILNEQISNGTYVSVRDTQENYWWVIIPPTVHLKNYTTIRLSPTKGVDTIISREFGLENTPFDDEKLIISSGQSAISPAGDQFVRWVPQDTVGVLLFDFDRTNGKLSNMRHILHPEKDDYDWGTSIAGGASYSPNGRFLYLNTVNNLFQYDMEAANIPASKVHIAEYDGFTDPKNNFPTLFNLQQMAPNCRIYMTSGNTVRYMHVINHPNRKGKACGFEQHSFQLPGNSRRGIPYHPYYRLDTEYALCDSVTTNIQEPWDGNELKSQFFLYPNPAHDYAVVEWRGIDPVEIQVYDLTARLLLQDRIIPGSPEYYLELNHLSSGLYIIKLQDREGRYLTERLVVKR